jgi:hypothetical protein
VRRSDGLRLFRLGFRVDAMQQRRPRQPAAALDRAGQLLSAHLASAERVTV